MNTVLNDYINIFLENKTYIENKILKNLKSFNAYFVLKISKFKNLKNSTKNSKISEKRLFIGIKSLIYFRVYDFMFVKLVCLIIIKKAY